MGTEKEIVKSVDAVTSSRIMRSARSTDLASMVDSENRCSMKLYEELTEEHLPWSVSRQSAPEQVSNVHCEVCDESVQSLHE